MKIVSFNCHSVRKNLNTIIELTETNDILLLQELMIYSDDINVIKQINTDFYSHICVNDKDKSQIINGRPNKGVAIMWRKEYDSCIEKVKVDDRINGIILKENDHKTLLLNVYMPYNNNDSNSLEEYCFYLGLLQSLIDDIQVNNVIIAGDLNADPNKLGFWVELINFINNNGLIHCSSVLTPSDFTYLCPARSTTSTLDHVISSSGIGHKISNIEVLYDKSLYDHFPIRFSYDVEMTKKSQNQGNNEEIESNEFLINWDKITDAEVKEYQSNLDILIELSDIEKEINESRMRGDFSREFLNDFYFIIINIILLASSFLTNLNKRAKGFKRIVGWNEFVKKPYSTARQYFLEWKFLGKPLDCEIHHRMLESRKNFRNSLKQCKRNEQIIIKNKIANAYNTSNSKKFWKEIKNRKGVSSNDIKEINNEKCPRKILGYFFDYFKSIFDDPDVHGNEFYNEDDFNGYGQERSGIRINDVESAIKRLNLSFGIENIYSQHLKFASAKLVNLITVFINICLNNSFVPPSIMDGII